MFKVIRLGHHRDPILTDISYFLRTVHIIFRLGTWRFEVELVVVNLLDLLHIELGGIKNPLNRVQFELPELLVVKHHDCHALISFKVVKLDIDLGWHLLKVAVFNLN